MAAGKQPVVLVTGAASGIGSGLVRHYRSQGAAVVLCDIDVARGQSLARELGGRFHALDVADPEGWQTLQSFLMQEYGGIDVACLNAGIPTLRTLGGEAAEFDIAALPIAAYRRVLGVNVDGVVFGTRALVPALAARGGGAIVVTASLAGLIAYAGDPIYALTKHAVVGLVRGLAPLLASRKIRIHAICPGMVDTGILEPGVAERARGAGIPVLSPEEIAQSVAALVQSGDTGQLLVCLPGRADTRYVFAKVPGFDTEPEAR